MSGVVRAPRARTLRASVQLGLLDNLTGGLQEALAKFGPMQTTKPAPAPPVVIREDYTLAIAFLLAGLILTSAGSQLLNGAGSVPGILILLLGILFTVQAGRIRFVFDDEAFELKARVVGEDVDVASPALRSTGENIVVGGENRWSYASFVNWEFFPKGWLEAGLPPILVYFKETQTPGSQWNVGPGKSANSAEALAKGAVPGQVHFFPALCDCKQMREQFETRGCKRIGSP